VENILSNAEVDALMSAMSDAPIDEDVQEELESLAVSYDITSQDRIVRGRLPGLDSIHDRCARNLARDLGLMLRSSVSIRAESGALIRHSELMALLPSPAKLALLRMTPLTGFSLLSLDPSLVDKLLGALLGGDLELDTGGAGEFSQEVTPVQERLLRRLFVIITANIEKAWQPVYEIGIDIARVEFDPRQAAVGVGSDLVLAASLEVNIEEESIGRIVIGIPFSALEPVRKMLGEESSADSDGQSAVAEDAMHEHMLATNVEIRCIFGESTLSVRDLMDLQVDDVVRLESGPNTPLTCLVEDQARFFAKPVLQAGNISCEILGAVSKEELENE